MSKVARLEGIVFGFCDNVRIVIRTNAERRSSSARGGFAISVILQWPLPEERPIGSGRISVLLPNVSGICLFGTGDDLKVRPLVVEVN